jgi:branched-subunit amino acid transport protein AzlD
MVGYSFMATLLLMQLVDLCVRSWPFRIHSPAWRLSFIGTGASAISAQLLVLFVIFGLALLAEDRAVAYLVVAVSAFTGLVCLIAAGSFALDVLQMKSTVDASLASSYDVGSVWVLLRLVVGAVLFLVLAVSSWRTAKGIARHRAAAGTPARASWLLSPVRAAAPVAPQPPSGAEAKTR